MLGSAFNEGAPRLVPEFIRQLQPSFPIGFSSRESVQEYLQHPPYLRTYVPELVFMDRSRMIRAQYSGENDFFRDQERNIRAQAESLLKEPVAAKKPAGAAKKKRS